MMTFNRELPSILKKLVKFDKKTHKQDSASLTLRRRVTDSASLTLRH